MLQIRVHGRGGQGVVTTAELIAYAAFKDGYFAQAFPFFGVERSGAPITAFARIDKKTIITREQIYEPNYLIILDSTLINDDVCLKGITPNTKLIINSKDSPETISKLVKRKIKARNILTIPASEIALNYLERNIVNTVVLGAFARLSGTISMNSLKSAITEKLADKGSVQVKKNINAVNAAFKYEEIS
ncbi:pyruvate ferredoxin oxidoreductase [Candidatus Falkowbacteria bacterium HGW-Falkowbacteria-2]|uniref:Pyruvate ferredoxin oxidoreductase n=1 Tax=Candidatus Falkowbacteria bacterium HGW-Falkowbacteria-2 TaxID=2013769 RepID=A0A2N2E0Q6_9BACT|nr:MAG: pyruvate ferredoxin oxidoreductase [Candidatus Falkowbacteria bacterium HGW-Falkowbacteria-2]